MVFCILDRATTYNKVCDAFDILDKNDLTYRHGIVGKTYMIADNIYRYDLMEQRIIGLLRGVGYRWPNQGAKNVLRFGSIVLNLRTASRDEIIEKIHGVSYKLASMFIRNTRGDEVAVIDTHIKKWLQEQGCTAKNYIDQEVFFLNYCREHGLDPYEFDMKIWEEKRR